MSDGIRFELIEPRRNHLLGEKIVLLREGDVEGGKTRLGSIDRIADALRVRIQVRLDSVLNRMPKFVGHHGEVGQQPQRVARYRDSENWPGDGAHRVL
ncbi:hypothetical protein GON04_25690 [Ramlibacter sp. MAH-25]|uniref:Uncharacterized protein n=1 Tax=Ramlibacter pinisoli TaxID=2682844 RepID=A0A6N8J0P7_9BURK|nr:hypothetical protein [Ramlibacter sp. CGMCC 1.13660]MBA2962928.1 hypothetical protein [Ramlibacter sp. CGMCC 1.13660]MVQ32871.1 hypothetical protein [Ramlibacter pinisoli]